MEMLTDYTVADAAKLVSDKPVPSEKKPPVRICDFVVFSDVHGDKHRGLVRWIGTDKSALPDGSTIVGIETVNSLNGIAMCLKYIMYSMYISMHTHGMYCTRIHVLKVVKQEILLYL